MADDDEAMVQAERKAAKLVREWLTWFRTQSVEALPGVRMDILIKRTGPGAAEVYTLELTELGFSMLGVDTLPPLVFGALLTSCFDDTGPTPEEARRLTEGTKRLEAKGGGSHWGNGGSWTKVGGDGKPEGKGQGHGKGESHKDKRSRMDDAEE